MNWIKRHTHILFLFAIVFLLGTINYQPGTLLTGGDNLHPEFDIFLNIKRSLFSVWQEYQGAGLLGGMGHASDLIRQLLILPLTIIFPTHFVRYFLTILTLLIGSIGAFFLTKTIVATSFSEKRVQMLSLIAGVFYVLNMGTLQQYFIPFEVFTMHFASLPWLLWGLIRYLASPSIKRLALFSFILLLATPAGYVPTLFVVFLIAVTLILVFSESRATLRSQTSNVLKKWFGIMSCIVFVNAFWLLPFAYFTLTSASVNVHAKINQMATESIFLLNKEYGSLADVASLKGFVLSSTEPNSEGKLSYVMEVWREHLANPLVRMSSMLLFLIILFGVFHAFRQKNPYLRGIAVIFIVGVTMMTTATPPFSWIDALLRDYVPLFGQIFRFPFTKFVTLTSLTYAVLLAFGVGILITKLEQYTRTYSVPSQFSRLTLPSIVFLLIGIHMFPVFTGNLFYEKEQLAIPKDYEQVFKFFKTQPTQSRIANFPQPSFWSWEHTNWGYSGSGFLWYGIEQPILDRAFDPWSASNEQYYFELSHALYSKNSQDFENVLTKYQISWLFVDTSVTSPASPKALFLTELEELLKESPHITKVKTFGKVAIYEYTPVQTGKQSFVYTAEKLPTVNASSWSEIDTAFTQYGNYQVSKANTPAATYYPFRSLFSQKTAAEKTFTMSTSSDTLVFSSTIPASQQYLRLPSYDTASVVPVQVRSDYAGEILTLSLLLQTPTVTIDGKTIAAPETSIELYSGKVTTTLPNPVSLNINGIVDIPVANKSGVVKTTFLSLTQDNVLTLTNLASKTSQTLTIPQSVLTTLPELQAQDVTLSQSTTERTLEVTTPILDDDYLSFTPDISSAQTNPGCEAFRHGPMSAVVKNDGTSYYSLSAQNNTACISYYNKNLLHTQGYVLLPTTRNTKGRGLHLWVENPNEGYAPLDTYLSDENELLSEAYILSPQESFGQGYAFHFDNVSIGNDPVTNELHNLQVTYIPYTFLTNLTAHTEPVAAVRKTSFTSVPETSVNHPNESLFIVKLSEGTADKTLILSQAYHAGWAAYSVSQDTLLNRMFPFMFGDKITEHVKVNNWENGWVLPENSSGQTIVLVFLPQYLQYIGFSLLVPFVLFVVIALFRSRRSRTS